MKRKKRRVKFRWLLLAALLLAVGVGVMGLRIRFPIHYFSSISAHANTNGIDRSWILAVIMAESSFRPEAESPRGARGLMQLMPATATWLAGLKGMQDFKPEDVWKPDVNIALGSYYLKYLLNIFNDDMTLALAAYNAGQGNVRSWLDNPEYSADGKTLDVIPFPETHRYINRVQVNQRVYAFRLWLRTFNNGGQRQ
jgi:soluble lytic murein transglycosylase